MKRYFSILALLFVLFGLVSCSQASSQVDSPTPESGKATVTGRVLSSNTGQPYSGIIIRLAEVYRNDQGEGTFALDTNSSPYSTTDENGYFTFTNVDPGEFVMVLGDPMTRYLIIENKSGKEQTWEIPENETTDLGEIKADFDQ